MYIYSNFSNTGLFKLQSNFLSSPIFRTFFKVPSLDYPQFF